MRRLSGIIVQQAGLVDIQQVVEPPRKGSGHSKPRPAGMARIRETRQRVNDILERRQQIRDGKVKSCLDLPGIHSISMGAGVQTTALLLRFWKFYEHVIFADTGDEQPETYDYIKKYLRPFCDEKGIKWHTVRHAHYKSLMEKCMDKRLVPNTGRRWCTQEFKIEPIQRRLRELGATARNPIHVSIGISLDESHRMSSTAHIDRPLYEHKVYPLLDYGITRSDCYRIITDHGWPVPRKSGCDYCPFMKRSEMRKLKAERPERYSQIVAMEKNSRQRKPLFGTRPLAEPGQALDEWFSEKYDGTEDALVCDSGRCFV